MIGGFAAVVDSTIVVNFAFHNTLWVPGHFHHYFVAGYFLMLWAFLYEFSASTRDKLAKIGLSLLVVGAYGFLLMFYLGGAFGVPRRFATYNAIPITLLAQFGERTAAVASGFVVILAAGTIHGLWRRLWCVGEHSCPRKRRCAQQLIDTGSGVRPILQPGGWPCA